MGFAAVVADIRLESRVGDVVRWQMLLDPVGFGVGEVGMVEAVARSGARIEVPVLEVVADGDELWCVVEKPLAAGTRVWGEAGSAGNRE